MTYSLNTLNSSRAEVPARSGWVRFASELGLFGGLVLLVLWLLAMLSYSGQDAAWSTSGGGGAIANRAGKLGALLADISYFLLGLSVWWCFAAGVRAWLSALARWMRGLQPQAREASQARASMAARLTSSRTGFWLGLVVLLCASTALEWSRIYRFESTFLPGHAGGALGYLVGPASVKWLGFLGSGLVAIALGVLGSALVFRFSWGHVSERMGGWLYSQIESRRSKREIAQDLALGQQAAREREEVVIEEREEIAVHHPVRVMIEPVLVDLPKSGGLPKNGKNRFSPSCPTANCPRLICWTARRQGKKPWPLRHWR